MKNLKTVKSEMRKEIINKLKSKPKLEKIEEDEKIWNKLKTNPLFQKSKNIFGKKKNEK